MILKYGVKNFFGFRESMNISFELGRNCPKSISNGKNITNILGVKGANASGKTNALKALSFLSEFCCNSFSYKPEARIFFESFYSNDEPTEFYVDFVYSGTQYMYELSLTNKQVISEFIYKKKKNITKILHRSNNNIEVFSKKYESVLDIKLRSNASIISTSRQYENKELREIYDFFKFILSNVTFSGFSEDHKDKHLAVTDFYKDSPDLFDFVKETISKCDTGVSDIEIKTSKDEDGKETNTPVFLHEVDGELKRLSYNLESSGTQSLYKQLAPYALTLKFGGCLILDEFDIYLHPHLLPLILNLFLNPEVNRNDAQLIFTTHNSEILDFLGKYRTIFINKTNNESFGYRLDEIPGDMIRNDRPIVPLYDAGKIGGVGSYDLD